jgi:hypothetical protein
MMERIGEHPGNYRHPSTPVKGEPAGSGSPCDAHRASSSQGLERHFPSDVDRRKGLLLNFVHATRKEGERI